jgi:hypothetical protein
MGSLAKLKKLSSSQQHFHIPSSQPSSLPATQTCFFSSTQASTQPTQPLQALPPTQFDSWPTTCVRSFDLNVATISRIDIPVRFRGLSIASQTKYTELSSSIVQTDIVHLSESGIDACDISREGMAASMQTDQDCLDSARILQEIGLMKEMLSNLADKSRYEKRTLEESTQTVRTKSLTSQTFSILLAQQNAALEMTSFCSFTLCPVSLPMSLLKKRRII